MNIFKTLNRTLAQLRAQLYSDNSFVTDSFDIIFIVSTGRTGTRFLANYFMDNVPEVVSYHEPEPAFEDLGVDFALNRAEESNVQSEIKKGRMRHLLETKQGGYSTYLESNNRLFSLVPILDELYHCKFLHIVRDGRDFVRSGMSRSWYTSDDKHPRLKASLLPDDPYHEQWELMNRFEKICWRWMKKDSFIREGLKNVEQTLTVRFEDIFNQGDKYFGMNKVLKFVNSDLELDMDYMGKKYNITSQYSIPHWTDWDSKRRTAFENIAGDHMDYYDYL